MGYDYYVLDGKTPRKVGDVKEWVEMFDKSNRLVARNRIGDVSISTVFLGVDHNFWGGLPLLFESMVFGGPLDQVQCRYSTWDEAEEGHRNLLRLVQGRQNENNGESTRKDVSTNI